jgi:hypothetical protein
MELLESTSQSFIVKVWIEDSPETSYPGVWHGHVTHVPGGERYYVNNLDELPDLIAPYLEAMGVKLGIRWRVRRWLKRLKRR